MIKLHKLFCIPYAGGNADSIYMVWKKYLNPNIVLQPVEYSGHGKRMLEPLKSSIIDVVQDIFEKYIESEITESSNYMIYGHSMGTIVAYELLKMIKEKKYNLPHTVFLSGRYSPHVPYLKERLYQLPDKIFLNRLVELGGVPANIKDYPELVNTYIPIIKNDYSIIENYKFKEPVIKTNSEFIFLYSDNDPYVISRKKVEEWEQYCNRLTIREFAGNHFFINEKAETICNIINQSGSQS